MHETIIGPRTDPGINMLMFFEFETAGDLSCYAATAVYQRRFVYY
jgi:hypothetical protein